MKERPILFSGAMIRAILDGSKSVTRRVMTPFPKWVDDFRGEGPGLLQRWPSGRFVFRHAPLTSASGFGSPYGEPGDRLWVRETWSHFKQPAGDRGILPKAMNPAYPWDLRFRADGVEPSGGRWRPAIRMPRWASRITLEVTGVRVERLQEITELAIEAEGVTCALARELAPGQTIASPFDAWRVLWDSINGARPGCSWADNPWLWVVEFRCIKAKAEVAA